MPLKIYSLRLCPEKKYKYDIGQIFSCFCQKKHLNLANCVLYTDDHTAHRWSHSAHMIKRYTDDHTVRRRSYSTQMIIQYTEDHTVGLHR